MTEIPPSFVPFFRRAFLTHRPAIQARMRSKPGGKFYRKHKPITDQDIKRHFTGQITLGCIYQRNNRGYIAAADLDKGGLPLLVELLEKCADRGLWAFAIAVDSGDHNGGHIFIPFEVEQDASALRELAGDITHAPELYPSDSDLRLPFGLHQRARTRGTLLLQDGTQYDLDADLAGGFALLESRWQPNPGMLPASASSTSSTAPASSPAPACLTRATPRSGYRESPRTLVSAVLDQFDIEDRLQQYQARKARNIVLLPLP